MMNEASTSPQERIQQEAVSWQVRLTSGNVSDATRQEFERWMSQSIEHAQAYRDIASLWQQLPGPLSADRQRRIEQAARRRKADIRRYSFGMALAASVLLTVLTGFYPDYLTNPLADYRTHIGEQRAVTLADGSIVHLNTDTAIDVALSDTERRIELLHGEVEFAVAHDAGRPFRVISGATITEALGTRFIVRYDGKGGQVSLMQGSVRTSRSSSGSGQKEQVVLQAGQQIAFDDGELGTAHVFEASGVNAWKRGRLSMNFVPLKQVIAEINRYRRVPIKLLNDELGEREVNIAVDLEHVDEWLAALQESMQVTIIKAGPWVLLRS